MEKTEHHIWCNGLPTNPVKGCRWCDPKGDGSDGLWAKYPYDTNQEAVGLVKKHFPEAISREQPEDQFCKCRVCGEVPLSGECLDMIREVLEGLGKDMSATPAMFYPEAIRSLLFNALKDAGVFPGHPAKYRYEPNGDGSFKRVEIDVRQEVSGP